MAETNKQLVGIERCLEVVFTDPASRPALRTFRGWQRNGYFRYQKIGRRVFYNPEQVAADLARRFEIKAVNPASL